MKHDVIAVEDRSHVLASAAPVHFECSTCEVIHNTPGGLPDGWTQDLVDGRLICRCPDCSPPPAFRSRAVALPERAPLAIDFMGWATLPNPDTGHTESWFLYSGCRIRHWLVPDTGKVALQLIGGAERGEANAVDDAVLVALGRQGLRDLIEHLETIEDQLAQGGLTA